MSMILLFFFSLDVLLKLEICARIRILTKCTTLSFRKNNIKM